MKRGAGVLLLVCSQPLLAQHAEDFFLDDAPTALTATRLKQSLFTAPAAITVIDKAMIKASGAKEIVELFRLVPGMQVGYERKNLPSVTYHGMADEFSRDMQVLIDGHSIYSASFGGVHWDDYPLLIEDIERIEVIRGPNAATYGPNSFLGVINIITTHSLQDQGAKVSFRGGSNDYYRAAARYGGRWKDLSYRLAYMHQQEDGLEGVADDQLVDVLSTRFDYRLSEQSALQYNFGYSADKSQSGTIGSLTDPVRHQRSRRISQNLSWTYQPTLDEQLLIQLTHFRRDSVEPIHSALRNLNNDTMSERLDFELQHSTLLFDDLRVAWGVGSRLDRIRLPFWLSSYDDKTNVLYRIFANFEWKFLDDFILNLGALLEKNSYQDADISPRIALNYLWSDQHSFRFIASRASRMPTIGEQYIDIRRTVSAILPYQVKTTSHLLPEELYTLELGYHGQYFNKALTADLKFAHQRFRRLTQITGSHIDPQTLEPVMHYQTADVATALNYEMQLDYRPNRQILLHLGYSWINIDASPSFIDYGASAPHHSLNVLASYQFLQRWQASVSYYYQSKMTYLRSSEIGQFQRLDLMLNKSFQLNENQSLNVAVIHQNVLGSKDEFSPGDRLSDQTLFQISYRFD
ncbi:TonB-dependent receptor plug domain-containing protein [Methylomarinum vadi]|uniref:TonB-dependent receptor plug domain-containing protein n=1 Tax=Methylomarinum vadi TaxID=438855 RepID=UPI0004DEE7B7|nr:TonB-dependent receptor [Methylomarinum vadi]